MQSIKLNRRNTIIIIAIAAVATVTGTLSYLIYSQQDNNYGQLTLMQLDHRLLPNTVTFSEISQEEIENSPKLKDAVTNVAIKYRGLLEECPPNRPVYCDIPSATRYTTGITSSEFDNLQNIIDFQTAENRDEESLQSFLKYRCFDLYFSIGISIEQYSDPYCYYRIELQKS
jgi:hypothetical protein